MANPEATPSVSRKGSAIPNHKRYEEVLAPVSVVQEGIQCYAQAPSEVFRRLGQSPQPMSNDGIAIYIGSERSQ